jgi:trehalose 6-phosphate phosphatase
MKNILCANNRSDLKKFTSANVLMAFDFDGTLASIVSDPDRAAIRPRTRRLLQILTSLYPCIVVSGRSREDVRQKLDGIRFREYIGNHGIEPWNSSRAMLRKVEAWIPILKHKLRCLNGVIVENKGFSVSVHYRRAHSKKRALKTITAVARGLSGAKLFGGKQVVNIVPQGAPDKGQAVERARRQVACEKVIYVGDDQTDEDVFALAQQGRFLTIRVGANEDSLADCYIRNQREIDRLLKTLIELRADHLGR